MPIPPIPAHKVDSPRERLKPSKSLAIIHSPPLWSLATGMWDDERCMLMRWNGTADKPRGNPVSHGKPTWFVIPDDPALQTALLGLCQPSDAEAARRWLDGGLGDASLPGGGLKP